ncbi:hypothetical protein [Nocardioides sp. cx-173]|uniref:hypothetical protein n=1 Tax=Nocardioides sp. cx-173 TaxID=2898796 RepID=UPI001E4284BA|nr:hypothetical protein [Nocardioides sp. cx-173]MCD4523701.1 hypothetical protein [Nocardioides sp. cx-173]UGB41969.1 hypothetical protein LQ940_00170 [Nocardioides sp. cx-173]
MRYWGAALAVAAAALSGCSAGEVEPAPAPPSSSAGATADDPEADPDPARAALALVPDDATTLAVTDFDQVRLELGAALLTGASAPAEREAFWRRAIAQAPLLSTGVLRPSDARLLRDYGFAQDDVAWEASFTGPSGEGWLAGLREGLDLTGVRRAVADGVGPLAGGVLDEEARVLAVGAAPDEGASWGAEPVLVELVGGAAMSTYVERGCVSPADPALDELDELDELEAWSVSLGALLATVRLGADRGDAFARVRLAEPPFAQGVADPVSGRLGYAMTDPALAARRILARDAPFAACAP